MEKIAEIRAVLREQRLVEAILRLQRTLDLRHHVLLLGERSARGETHQEEGDGNDGKQHRNRLQQAQPDEALHLAGSR